MKRYILIFNNGEIVQQKGINMTYMQMTSLGVLKMIFDTKEGKVIVGDDWKWKEIPSYHGSDLVVMEEDKSE